MELSMYKALLNELRKDGVKVEELTIMQIKESIKLYKVLNRGGQINEV